MSMKHSFISIIYHFHLYIYGERKVFRKIVSGITSILLVLSMFSLLSCIQPVRASGTIYIRADGSTAPIEQDNDFITQSDVDWWPMFHHDSSHSGYSTSNAPTTNQTLWNYTTSYNVFSSPAVANGKVYIGSEEGSVYCLDASTGAKLWNYTTKAPVFNAAAVADGQVYIGSVDGSVYCLDASTGAKLWNYTTGNRVHSSPAVVEGKVYIGSHDHSVYCLDASTGAKLWNYTTKAPVFNAAAVADGQVYIGSEDDNVYCLDSSTGAKLWNYTTKAAVVSSPAVADGKVYIGSWDHSVYCFSSVDDVAVTNATTSKTGCAPMPTVGQNFTVAVNVTVANVGDYNESAVNVTSYATQTTYYNATTHSWTSIPPTLQTPIAIGSNLVNLDVRQNTTITFDWNTTGFAYGNYTISAYAWPVPGETNTLDNNFTGDVVTVTIPGDINGDFRCSLSDLSRLTKAFNTYPGDAKWNPNADINSNGNVGLSDLSIMAKHYNQHYP